ncbi:uncharacterized protein CEXT_535561 [Caerostris extrusa]|uniref:E3 ubiquitin-protein ligase RNF180 n=1 Tax=Caerostris extrusa TaxID=172846 RepID=A0AAV4XBV6_CAEEX|nr:uncharacterized protein CEXT_535561 [Caerostris extrusa]
MKTIFKCGKCRHMLFTEREVCDGHGLSYENGIEESLSCKPLSNVYYMKEDSFLPWIREQINGGDWMKGKLHCPVCKTRLGSYNFVKGAKCLCGRHVLPSLHLTSAKIDRHEIQYSGSRLNFG